MKCENCESEKHDLLFCPGRTTVTIDVVLKMIEREDFRQWHDKGAFEQYIGGGTEADGYPRPRQEKGDILEDLQSMLTKGFLPKKRQG